MNVLGIWDGHDSGAALLQDGRLRFAINEERLTRRKLEIRFPSRSIDACLAYAGLAPEASTIVAASTVRSGEDAGAMVAVEQGAATTRSAAGRPRPGRCQR